MLQVTPRHYKISQVGDQSFLVRPTFTRVLWGRGQRSQSTGLTLQLFHAGEIPANVFVMFLLISAVIGV